MQDHFPQLTREFRTLFFKIFSTMYSSGVDLFGFFFMFTSLTSAIFEEVKEKWNFQELSVKELAGTWFSIRVRLSIDQGSTKDWIWTIFNCNFVGIDFYQLYTFRLVLVLLIQANWVNWLSRLSHEISWLKFYLKESLGIKEALNICLTVEANWEAEEFVIIVKTLILIR